MAALNAPLDSADSKLNLRSLVNELSSVKNKWFILGVQLKIDAATLKAIEKDHPRDCERCLLEMLEYWLKGNEGIPSWRSIVKALRSSSMLEVGLAARIEAEYCSSACSQSDPQDHDQVRNARGTQSDTDSASTGGAAMATPSVDHGREESTEMDVQPSVATVAEPSTGSFPLLEEHTSHLSQEDREHLEVRLRLETQEIMEKYYDLLTTFCQSLCDNEVSIEELVRYLRKLKAYDPVEDVPQEQQKSLMDEHMQQLRNAKSIDEIFDVIEKYCTFFNYKILADMIEKYGTENDKALLQVYKEDFNEYAERRIHECPSNFVKEGEPRTKGKLLRIKLDSKYDKYNLRAVENFQASLSKILKVSEKALILCKINEGCVELTFRIPAFVQTDIFPISSSQEKSLKDLGVLFLSSGAYNLTITEGTVTGDTSTEIAQRNDSRMAFHVLDAIKKRPAANGLAIIIANEHSIRKHKPSLGARKDLDTTKQAFERLKFATVPVLNASRDEILQVIQAAVSIKYQEFAKPSAYKRLVFYFSGYGSQDFIYTHDGQVNFQSEVFHPFQPQNAPHLTNVTKLFFMDVCQAVGREKTSGSAVEMFQSERDETQIQRTTSNQNYLLAFSNRQSHEEHWTQELAEQLCNTENINRSIHDVLTMVNKKAHYKHLQQPSVESTLVGEPVRLLREAVDIETIPDTEPYFRAPLPTVLGSGCFAIMKQKLFKDPGDSSLQGGDEQGYYYRGLLNHFRQTNIISDYHDYGVQEKLEGNSTLFRSSLSFKYVSGKTWILGKSKYCASKSEAKEEAARDACTKLEESGLNVQDYQGQFESAKPEDESSQVVGTRKGDVGVIRDSEYYVSKSEAEEDTVRDVKPKALTHQTRQAAWFESGKPKEESSKVTGLQLGQAEQHIRESQFSDSLFRTQFLPESYSPSISLPLQIPDISSLKGGNERGYYRGLLNHYRQTNIISDYWDQTEKIGGSQTPIHKCILGFKHVATQKQISGRSRCYTSKSEAKEDAARDACAQLHTLATPIHQGRSEIKYKSSTAVGPSLAGPSLPLRQTESPMAKVWKARLKEYFDKKLKGKHVVISYKTKESFKKGLGFTSIVYCPEIGYAEGDKECPSKSAAEHSAAYHALKKLNAVNKSS